MERKWSPILYAHCLIHAHTDLVPYEDDTNNVDFKSINLLNAFGIGLTPIFSIVSTDMYVKEMLKNSSAARTKLLPPQFILSLSFKPSNNTVLRLFSSMHVTSTGNSVNNDDDSLPHSPLIDNQPSDGNVHPSEQTQDVDGMSSKNDVLASLLLSTTATYLQRDHYFDIWKNMSSSSYHSLVFIVANGTISSCFDGEFVTLSNEISLWDSQGIGYDHNKRTLTLQFSNYLHSVHSLVSRCLHFTSILFNLS